MTENVVTVTVSEALPPLVSVTVMVQVPALSAFTVNWPAAPGTTVATPALSDFAVSVAAGLDDVAVNVAD